MSEKNMNVRVQHKHDVEANWLKAVNFRPKAGELIIYDPDTDHPAVRIKIGNGTDLVSDLPFALDVLADVAYSGDIYELTQKDEDVIIFDGGTATSNSSFVANLDNAAMDNIALG